MLKNLYKKFRDLAGSKHAGVILGFVAFYDACILPTPPEVMLLPSVAMQPKKAWKMAAIATICSIIGGIFGYFLGMFLMDTIGMKFFEFMHFTKHIPGIKALYDKYGALAIMIKSLIPIPFMIVTWISGSLHYSFIGFIFFSLISRAIRFFAVAGLTAKYGQGIEEFIEKKLYYFTGAFALIVILIVYLMMRGH